MTKIYHPIEPSIESNIVETFVQALDWQPVALMETLAPFFGKGIYAIYYNGTFQVYESITKQNIPIYVGKTIHVYRGDSDDGSTNTRSLYYRLIEHSSRIKNTMNLEIAHFGCKYLVLNDIWPILTHKQLIRKYKPHWNAIIKGFSNHHPGQRRHASVTEWDAIHPCRNKTQF